MPSDENSSEISEMKSADIYEISFVPAGSQTGDEGFLVQKADKQDKQGDDDSMAEDKETVKVENLSEDDKKELFNKLKDEFDVESQVKMFLDGEEIYEEVKDGMEIESDKGSITIVDSESASIFDSEGEKQENETEKSMTPKSREALKTVLNTLSKVKEEMPENYRWVYKAIAKLVDETAPEFEKSADENNEITDEVREAVKESIEQFGKEDELSDTAKVIKEALQGMDIEKEEEEEEEISKEAEQKLEKMEQEMEKLREEKNELKQEKIKKQLTEKAEELENIPEPTEKLTELFAELYNLDEDVFEKVEKLIKKIDKQSEVGELFKEKGTSQRDTAPKDESADEKIDRLVAEKIEKEDKERSRAMEEVIEDNPDLYEETRGA